ncbi:MAG: hypothetical protein LBF23_00475 [Endomicrobium sp.]|jgi:hypothetical protein|nr:hypothetical protein [Endomicrobium sp.]
MYMELAQERLRDKSQLEFEEFKEKPKIGLRRAIIEIAGKEHVAESEIDPETHKLVKMF